MGATSDLKRELADIPGIETLQVTFGGGMQHITINGHTITVGALASIDQIRQALKAPMTDATPIPPNDLGQPQKPAPAPGGLAARLKAIVDGAKAGLDQSQVHAEARVREAVGKINAAAAATKKVADNMASQIESQAADVLAELGQISNSLGDENN